MAIDPNEYLRERMIIPPSRAQIQSNLDFAFDPKKYVTELNNRSRAERLAKRPAKQAAKARRRLLSAQRAQDAQLAKDVGARRAGQIAAAQSYAQMWTDTLQEQLNPTRSLSGVKKRTRNTGVTRASREARTPFTVRFDNTVMNSIPDPSQMTERQLENYARKMILNNKRNALTSLAASAEGVTGSDIEIQAVDLYNQERAAMRKQYGPSYRAKLREMATQDLVSQRENALFNLRPYVDQTPKVVKNFGENFRAERLPSGVADPNSLSNLPNNFKRQWMIESGAYPPMEPPKPAEKVFGQIRQGEIKLTDMSRAAKEQAVDVVKKAPVSAKTAARSMNAYVLAAAVAAGGLGLYGMNRQRGESQVGR